jgi:two-component system sensor histidine kinase HydH
MSALATNGQPAAPADAGPFGDLAVDDLRELMRAFNETTQNLERTHITLQTEVARLKTELAEANAQLRRSRELAALGEMAAGIAHEIRNPLGSINLYVQMLAEDLADAPPQSELCGKISTAVAGLDGIVRDVLMFARETRLNTDDAAPGDLIRQALASCDALIQSSDASIECDFADDALPMVCVDSGLIVQALSNVVRNAIEAMAENERRPRALHISAKSKRIRVPGGKRAQRIVIACRDTGPGVPDDVRERMFNPFFTTRATGTGLGLAIVHQIIDAHGGHVSVRNLAEGGACVELCVAPSKRGSANGCANDAPEIDILRRDESNQRGPRRSHHAYVPAEAGS